ncbi:discoidin domain-containing protein [Mariniflexile litorale]|uniref:Discoidin domain-containing protein n=1 Tax=Mariniflexile litorale TaxID=3045158 RepID=A0AAU7EEP4_9FLAO|nr:discoidin domain-containing protein [Mariniflexile sp. KMM 9835]MDQ8211950.1 discoidin domain-containing protein [Mariniflexile sp. KMM 9835]
MKTYFLKLNNIVYLAFLISLFSCDGRRDFPDLVESDVNLDNYDIILLISGDSQNVTASFEPNIVPNRDYVWAVDDPNVADLVVNEDKSVSLTATGSGSTTLRITAADDDSITASVPLKVISGAPVDITDQSTITVNREYNGGANGSEGSLKLIDNNLDTKYLSGYVAPFWINLEFDTPVIAGYYSFTSGNDAPSRDPRDWEIQGSLDGTTWDTLDTRTEYSFPDRKLTREFYFENSTAYKYYRFDVLKNNGNSLFQMQEWRLFSLPN